jgi:hypothetical protein
MGDPELMLTCHLCGRSGLSPQHLFSYKILNHTGQGTQAVCTLRNKLRSCVLMSGHVLNARIASSAKKRGMM